MPAGRPVFMTWSARTERAGELARAVGCEAVTLAAWRCARRWDAPLRWLSSARATVTYLRDNRPRAVVVQNPPIFLPMIAWAYRWVTGAGLILDSHPASFGRKGSFWGLFVPIHRAIAKRADLVLVSGRELAAEVQAWGAVAQIVHEAPPGWFDAEAESGPRERTEAAARRVLFVCVFAADEPVEAVIAAAAALPDVEILVTGDTRRAPHGLVQRAPANVTFTGFLAAADYARELRRADAILVLSTEPTSVPRAGYEAVYARRPLVITSTAATREYFPCAQHTTNECAGVATAIRRALTAAHDVEGALAVQLDRWTRQVEAVRCLLEPNPEPDMTEKLLAV